MNDPSRSGSRPIVRCIGCLALLLLSAASIAHPGRRFEVQIVDGRLVAQGVNTDEEVPHGEQPVRPYANAVHDHFTNYTLNGSDVAVANLPGFDIPARLLELQGHQVVLQVERVYELAYPLPTAATIGAAWRPLAAPRELTLTLGRQQVSSVRLPDSLTLSSAVPREGVFDLDPHYLLNTSAAEFFLVIVMRLETTAPGVERSQPICTVLGPPGHQFHGIALTIEQRLPAEGC